MKATAKKTICILISGATLGLGAAVPALAEPGHWEGRGWDRGYDHGHGHGHG